MTMSALPILASDREDTELRAALAAGWQRADLRWERLQEDGNTRFLDGDLQNAARAWGRARWIAALRFPVLDPRQATTIANLALIDRAKGREARARKRYAKAVAHWQRIDTYIADMTIARRARSSLFHLRMEAMHWDTYTDNARARFRTFAVETAEALAALEQGKPVEHRLFERWRGEKPNVYDDTRRFLGAALLIGGGRQSGPNQFENETRA